MLGPFCAPSADRSGGQNEAEEKMCAHHDRTSTQRECQAARLEPWELVRADLLKKWTRTCCL